MAENELIVRDEDAVEWGNKLGECLNGLAEIQSADLSDVARSLARIVKKKALKKVLQNEIVQALIIDAAGEGYECAESKEFKFTPAQKLEGATKAMMRGYLPDDEHGPQFTVIVGKGGVSTLIKENGHRYKLHQFGAKNVAANAWAVQIQARPNNDKKFDMIVEGYAECTIDGELVRVERIGESAMRLPCYESDGPDGAEGKGKRRLVRDLWQRVSGNFDPIELDEVEFIEPENIEAPLQKRVAETKRDTEQEAKDSEIRERVSLANAKMRAEKMLEKDESALSAFRAVWASVETAVSTEALNEVRTECRPTVEMFSESIQTTLRKHLAHCSRKLETKNT